MYIPASSCRRGVHEAQRDEVWCAYLEHHTNTTQYLSRSRAKCKQEKWSGQFNLSKFFYHMHSTPILSYSMHASSILRPLSSTEWGVVMPHRQAHTSHQSPRHFIPPPTLSAPRPQFLRQIWSWCWTCRLAMWWTLPPRWRTVPDWLMHPSEYRRESEACAQLSLWTRGRRRRTSPAT